MFVVWAVLFVWCFGVFGFSTHIDYVLKHWIPQLRFDCRTRPDSRPLQVASSYG